jgi:hypothetical protein
VTGRKRLCLQPPADCGGLRIQPNGSIRISYA